MASFPARLFVVSDGEFRGVFVAVGDVCWFELGRSVARCKVPRRFIVMVQSVQLRPSGNWNQCSAR